MNHPTLFDTHAHVHFNAYKEDSTEIIRVALEGGTWMVTVGTQKDTSARGIVVANQYEIGVWASVGLHPNHLFPVVIDEDETPFTTREEDFDRAYYDKLCDDPKVVAIGECGLDYYRIPEGLDIAIVKEKQERVFRAHLDLAHDRNLPVICHIRDAHDETLAILTEYVHAGKLTRRGIIHCYTAEATHANAYTEIGFYVSFSGVITFEPRKNSPEAQLQLWEAVKTVPLDKLLIETDAPYLTPLPYRGQRNQPSYVALIAHKVAALRGMTFEDVARVTSENARRVFNV